MTDLNELLSWPSEKFEAEITRLKNELERTRMGLSKVDLLKEYLELEKAVKSGASELAAKLESLKSLL